MIPVEEALRKIRAAKTSNGDYLDDLRERLTGARPIPLVPFVGAGLSMPMGFPSWGEFLTLLAAECGKSEEITTLLLEGKYEEAAETVERGLGSAIFNRRVAHIFGERRSKECELRGAVLALPDLAGGAVVTTNFDRVLERVFAEAGSPFEYVAWGSKVDSIRRAMAENKPFLLKIHGDAEERSDRVLTKADYDAHYAVGNPEGLRAQLGRVFQGRTLLFVGCSLGKDRTIDVLSDVLKHASGLEHFAIVAKPTSDEQFVTKQQLLGARGILPIWYPESQHDLIEPLLKWIASLQPSGRVAGPELVLERSSQRKKEIRSELDLLIPYQRTSTFVGRSTELEDLRAWLRSEAAVSVRVMVGSGGSGKTRLGVELTEWLDEAEPRQWNFGFLTPEEMERFSGLQNLSQWRRRKPVLAVVDYAAGCAEWLRVWLEQLTATEHGGEKLRLLLLERHASPNEGWLASVIRQGHSSAAVRALFDRREPMQLDAVAEAADRRSVLRATLEAAAALRGVTALVVPVPGVDAFFDRTITETRWGDPLTVMMAGLTALDTGLVTAMALTRADLAFRLADRERDRLERFGQGAPASLMEHLAAYVTVSGGLSREELRQAAKTESEVIGRTHPGGWGVLADRVGEALHGGDGARPVEPDVVGEALLLRVWGGSVNVHDGCQAVVRAAEARARQVAASVVRAAQDFCVGDMPRSEPLEWLDSLIVKGKSDLTLLLRIEGEMPQRTLALRKRALEVYSMLAAVLRERTETDEGVLPLQARVLDNLGIRLSDLGRRAEALKATKEAVGIYRQLAKQYRDDFLASLACSLDNLGNRLSDVGRHEEAFRAADKAVELYRKVAAQYRDAFLPDLALSLNNLGIRLSALGQREEALRATKEAVGLYRKVATKRPDAFLPGLAMSLNNLGIRLSDVERHEEAFQATDEAVRLYRKVATQRPDAFLPDLARSLHNFGNRLGALGKREEALQATDEAVRIRQRLATHYPDAFLPDLARSLDSLGVRLSEVERHEDAFQATDKAVRLYRKMATQHPDVFLPGLAGSLHNLGIILSVLGRREEALQAIDKAVRVRRRLAKQYPDALLPDLATSLYEKGVAFWEVGDAVGAAATFREGVECLKPLFLRLPSAFRFLMATLVVRYIQVCPRAELDVDSRLLADIMPRLLDDKAQDTET